jgi:hypothetical protein
MENPVFYPSTVEIAIFMNYKKKIKKNHTEKK